MLPVYLVSLGLSAGITGVYARRLLAAEGFVPGFEAGVMLAVAVACAYLALQMLYMGLLRIFVPGRSTGAFVFETLSNGASVFLAPFLLGISAIQATRIDRLAAGLGLPESMTEKLIEYEPFMLLAAFLAVHAVLKLFSLYSMTCARYGGRLPAVAWLLACGFCIYGAMAATFLWHKEMAAARVVGPGQLAAYRAGTASAMARQLPEGAVFRFEVDAAAPRNIVLRWANPPGEPRPLDSLHAVVRFPQTAADSAFHELALPRNGWAPLRIPAVQVPEGARECEVIWTSTREPAWLLQAGLRPTGGDVQTMLMSGPDFHEPRALARDPNLVVILIEGLGAEHVSGLGYARETTPGLDRIAADGISFPNAFSPAPEMKAAAMSLLTGMPPVAHGYLAAHTGPLPPATQTLAELMRTRAYATAAFTEGDGPDAADLVPGSGFERGFETLDDYHAVSVVWRRSQQAGANPVISAGTDVTLNKAADWIEAHSQEKFFVLIRLRELRHPQWQRNRYGDGFVTSPAAPRPLDVYDTALKYVDAQLGVFYDRLREAPGLDNTVYLVTSPYGFDFSDGWGSKPERRLTEPCLRVPLVLAKPGRALPAAIAPADFISLDDAAVSLAALAGVRFPQAATGRSLFEERASRPPIAMGGNPLMLSIRTGDWRFTWQSGLDPATLAPVADAASVALVNIEWYRRNWRQRDNLAQNPQLVRDLTQRLLEYTAQHARERATPLTEGPGTHQAAGAT